MPRQQSSGRSGGLIGSLSGAVGGRGGPQPVTHPDTQVLVVMILVEIGLLVLIRRTFKGAHGG